ncbi:ABC transporter substrate-binding protein [Acidisphaera sp. S103]|uniref:ABC transporter substrate-binding protein n=1 Tax=Acidisphaera sp. S103 TaxID=1747223 RepID=UPI00131E8263|nr:ABC transporter substrate-binding protein [Acidisphaera sp. S103]
MRKTLLGTAAAVLIAGLALFNQPAEAAMTGKKFTILVITDLSTVFSDTSGKGSVDGVQMAVDDFGGSVNGVPINVIVLDNKLDVALTINKTREIIDSQGVNLITDVTSSAAAIAIAKLANERKITTTFVSPGTTALTNEDCSKYTWHYAWDTTAMATAAGRVTEEGFKKWYFITADYAFGHSLLEQFSKTVKAKGGTVLGNDMVPFPNDDFSSYLLKAQSAGAQGIGILESGQDLRNGVKQAREFGLLGDGKIQIVPGQMNFTDVRSTGIDTWSGITAGEIWYWNYDQQTRDWAARFKKRFGMTPASLYAGNYSAVTQVLNTVKKIGTDDPDKIAEALEGSTFSDFFARNATWRKKDHSVIHDMYVIKVKKASEVKQPEDYYDVVATIPGKDVFIPESESTCKHNW